MQLGEHLAYFVREVGDDRCAVVYRHFQYARLPVPSGVVTVMQYKDNTILYAMRKHNKGAKKKGSKRQQTLVRFRCTLREGDLHKTRREANARRLRKNNIV